MSLKRSLPLLLFILTFLCFTIYGGGPSTGNTAITKFDPPDQRGTSDDRNQYPEELVIPFYPWLAQRAGIQGIVECDASRQDLLNTHLSRHLNRLAADALAANFLNNGGESDGFADFGILYT